MICCAAGCGHKAGCGCHFYNFPSPNDGPDWEKWYDIWVLRVNRLNADGSIWRPETPNTKLCSCHFRPEDQWDPKSRKGGLKCKEPVFFDNNPSIPHMATSPTPVGIHQQQTGDVTCTNGNAMKRTWFVASVPNVSGENRETQEAKKINLKFFPGRKPKCKSLIRSSRMPPLKIREYFENKDGATSENTGPVTNSVKDTMHVIRQQQDFASNANLPSVCGLTNDSDWQRTHLQDRDPGVMDIEVIDVEDSDETAYDSTAHQIDIKHEQANSSLQFAHIEPTLHSQQTNSPISVKIEMDDSSLTDESLLEYNGEVIPRIISMDSVECHDRSEEQETDQQASSITQFVDMEHHNVTLKDNLEVVLPKNSTQKAKISNVKPIRVLTSDNLASQAMSCHREENTYMQSKNVYDQMFNKLKASGSRFQADPMQASISQDNVLNIADILSDTETSATNTISHLNLNQALNRIQELEKALSLEKFGLHRFCGSDEKIKFYTGFRSADTLMRFFWRIEPDDLTSERSNKWQCALNLAKEVLKESGSSEDVSQKVIPYIDELFLFLCHVWLGLQPGDLADRFALPSSSFAQFIILRWIYYLNATLPSTAESVKSTSTVSKLARFQGQYINTKLLLHQIEIRVQQKSIMNHLSSTKLKALVGFSPSGEVVFTSDVLSDVFSNRDLQNSGVLSLLHSGDGVIVESGFVSDDLFSSVGVVVHSLPKFDMPHDPTTLQLGTSTRYPHMCHTEVTRLLSAKHVSSVTGFKLFQSIVLYPFAHSIRDLWQVCCRLVNYQQGHRSL